MRVTSPQRGPAGQATSGTNKRRDTVRDTLLLISWVLGYAVLLRLFGLVNRMELLASARDARFHGRLPG